MKRSVMVEVEVSAGEGSSRFREDPNRSAPIISRRILIYH